MPEDLIPELRKAIKEERLCRVYDHYLGGIREFPTIYLVNNKVIGKWFASKRYAKNEYKIGRFLLENGVHVPEMYQMVPPDYRFSLFKKAVNDSEGVIDNWFILMQRLQGRHIRNLFKGKKKEVAVRQFKTEILKVLDLGILPIDCANSENSLFDIYQGALYLLDFEMWKKRGKKSDIEKIRREIMDIDGYEGFEDFVTI